MKRRIGNLRSRNGIREKAFGRRINTIILEMIYDKRKKNMDSSTYYDSPKANE